jgi:hypothetical protein
VLAPWCARLAEADLAVMLAGIPSYGRAWKILVNDLGLARSI